MPDSGSGESDAATRVSPPPSLGEISGSGPRSGADYGIGDTLGRYVVLEELGRGAMGRVLRAYDAKLQREVPLKEVRRLLLDEDGAARLVIEARAMAKLSHPNVVAVYDVEEHGDAPQRELVLVMEYVAGATLREWIDARKPPWGEIVAEVATAEEAQSITAHGDGLRCGDDVR